MENMINFGINENMVKPIIEKQMQAAILANIGNAEELIGKVVSHALNQKVDRNGDLSRYNSENNYNYLEVLTTKAIQEASKEALKDWLKENSQLVKAMVIKEMNDPKRQDSLVKAFADAVEESLKVSWRFDCRVDFSKADE